MDLNNELDRLQNALAKEFPEDPPQHEAGLVVVDSQEDRQQMLKASTQARVVHVLEFAQAIGAKLSPWQKKALPQLIEAQLKRNGPTPPTAAQQGIVNAAEAKRLRKMERSKVLKK